MVSHLVKFGHVVLSLSVVPMNQEVAGSIPVHGLNLDLSCRWLFESGFSFLLSWCPCCLDFCWWVFQKFDVSLLATFSALVDGYGEKAMSSICSPSFSSRWLGAKNVDLDRPLFYLRTSGLVNVMLILRYHLITN